MNFIALDVETSNSDMSSICQIGLVKYENGKIILEWETLLNPEDYFDELNVSIHGITEEQVKNSPKFPDIIEQFKEFLKNQIVVCHTHFDRVAIRQVFEKYKIDQPELIWLDTARVARRTWEDFAWKGYGLKNISNHLGYQYQAHDALEDAKACGNILLQAIDKTGFDIAGWLDRVKKPILNDGKKKITFQGNPDGSLYGDVIVFTGALILPRVQAAKIASKVGCKVKNGVTKETTILIVGDQDIKKLSGHTKSSKHRKAESLIKQGYDIRILCETDFEKLIQLLPVNEKDEIISPKNDKSLNNNVNSSIEAKVNDEHLEYFNIVSDILKKNNRGTDYLKYSYTSKYFDILAFHNVLRIKTDCRKKYILIRNSESVIKSFWKDAVCSPALKSERGWTRIYIDSPMDIYFLEKIIVQEFDKTIDGMETYRKYVKSGEKNIANYLKSHPPKRK